MKKVHTIKNVHFDRNKLIMTVDGKKKTFQLNIVSKPLSNASEAERNDFVISPSGYGIHWPQIDEDLSIDGLIGVKHQRKLQKKVA